MLFLRKFFLILFLFFSLTKTELSNECSELYASFCTENSILLCDEVFPLTCCKADAARGNKTWCITEFEEEICSRDNVCVSELIPGGPGSGECFAEWETSRPAGIIAYLLIIFYIFLGFAIVCDDYFVPAVSKLADTLGLSDDVAGPFMGIGTSAPGIFISLLDNVVSRPPKDISTGTIIGSAIYNVLIIVGFCAILSGQVLKLDWKPFIRDFIFYMLAIILLNLVLIDEDVHWWEAVILIFFYSVYVITLAHNSWIFQKIDEICITGKTIFTADDASEIMDKKTVVDAPTASDVEHAIQDKTHRNSANSVASRVSMAGAQIVPVERPMTYHRATRTYKFLREEILLHMYPVRDPNITLSFVDVVKIAIGVERVRKTFLGLKKRALLERMSSLSRISESRADEPDTMTSATARKILDRQDTYYAAALLEQESYWSVLAWPVLPDDVKLMRDKKSDDDDEMVFYSRSYFQRAIGDWKHLWKIRIFYILSFPLHLMFRFTIPDSAFDLFNEDRFGKPERRVIGFSLCFTLCIIWIGVLAQFLVYAAQKFGCLVGLSPGVVGLLLVGPGTSVPDTMCSVIVAKLGKGEMAVANAVSSNAFNFLVSLGIPWFLASIIFQSNVPVKTDDFFVARIFLFVCILVLFAALLARKWTLDRKVGIVLILLYMVYFALEIIMATL